MDGRMGNGVPNGKRGIPGKTVPLPGRSSELFANTTRSNVLGTVFMAVGYSCSAVTGFLLLLFVIGMLVGGVFLRCSGSSWSVPCAFRGKCCHGLEGNLHLFPGKAL